MNGGSSFFVTAKRGGQVVLAREFTAPTFFAAIVAVRAHLRAERLATAAELLDETVRLTGITEQPEPAALLAPSMEGGR